MPRHDVAIYMPEAGNAFDASIRRTGGAERQMVRLSRAMGAAGLRVAMIVYPIGDPELTAGDPRLVVRRRGEQHHLGRALEPAEIWRAMARADAATYVFRGASAALGPAAAFCAAYRRRLVFSAANDADFRPADLAMDDRRSALFDWGVGRAAHIVVQSEQQVALARERFPAVPVTLIPSFVPELPPAGGEPDRFLWAARIVDYKQPLTYVELARELPEARFHMVAVRALGDTTPDLEAELHEQAAATPNLELSGAIPHATLLELLDRTVAVVNTSTTEGMPNVWLEGWARGVPALSLRFDPDGRVVREGLGRVADGDWAAFVAATRELWDRRGDRGGFGAATRAYVERVHGMEAVGGRWATLLRGLG